MRTKTWFHTGAFIDREHISNYFAEKEYYRETKKQEEDSQKTESLFQTKLLPDTVLPGEITLADGKGLLKDLTAQEEREACRALKGSILRQEIYALDGTKKSEHPYSVSERNYELKWLQPRQDEQYAVFFTHPRETIDYHYERNPAEPRISHQMMLEVDRFGNVKKSAAIAYPRREAQAGSGVKLYPEQKKLSIAYTEAEFTNSIDTDDNYRTPVSWQTKTYELTGKQLSDRLTDDGKKLLQRHLGKQFIEQLREDEFKRLLKQIDRRFTISTILGITQQAQSLDYEKIADETKLQKRLIERVRTLYYQNDLSKALPAGKVDSLALPYESYKLAFTSGLLSTVYKGKIASADLGEGGYKDLDKDGNFWIPSGRQVFASAKFYLPTEFIDPFGRCFKTEYDDYSLLVNKTKDALPDPQTNIVKIVNDYRVMQPKLITDPNGNRSEVAFDALGMVVGTAVMGKKGEKKGDSLKGFEADKGFQADLDEAKLRKHLNDPLKDADQILGKATTRLVYDLWAYYRTKQKTAEGEEQGQPAVVYILARETHDSDLAGGKPTIQHSFLYSDGFGREIQTKIQAEGGKAPQRESNVELDSGYHLPGQLILENGKLKYADTKHRWVGTGRTIYNNKGKPVKQYEPFFSSTHLYEQEQELVEWGVTPTIHYDPLERVIRTDYPNGTFSKVEFDPWQQITWDENDTVQESQWYKERLNSQATKAERRAAKIALEAQRTDTPGTKFGTPTTAHLDFLGRAFLTIEDNGILKGERQLYQTYVQLDIEGNQLSIRDARNNFPMVNGIAKKDANEKIERDGQDNPKLKARTFDLLSNNLYALSMDAGERWTLNNVAGNPIRLWDGRKQQFNFQYDALQRPTHRYVQRGNGAKILIDRTVYGEFHPDSTANDPKLNLRGQVYQQYDGAGIVTNNEFDFKGNLLSSSRQLRKLTEESKQIVDWGRIAKNPNADVSDLMEQEIFTSKTAYDALNRPTSLITPHVPNQIPPSEIKPTYNEANLLEKIDVRLRDANDWTSFVRNINYNAKGQRELIQYAIKDKNNNFDENNYIETKYEYDPKTFRLIQLKTTRTTDNKKLQDFNYTYDPVGNITEIEDKSQQTIIFKGAVVPPNNQYEYDALYRLTKAKGREHLGQTGGSINRPVPTSDTDVPRVNLPHPGDGQAMGRYLQEYVYDAVGNILEMNHTGTDPRQPGWRRCYQYALYSNRLLSTGYQSDPQVVCSVENHYADASVYPDHYGYDSHGNMDRMPHLTLMQWDCDDQLQASSTQAVNNGGTPETTYYLYDASGQRVRKVTERKAEAGQQPTRLKERIYLNGFEIYRKYDGRGATVNLERETLHIMDDEQQIALVETKTKDQQGNDRLPKQLTRYQLGNHLGSVSLELDRLQGKVISYEEFYPYGSTSYQAIKEGIETPKRYRYTGKERDEENHFSYHGARYYIPWLGRWTSYDPAETDEDINSYSFIRNRVIVLVDPSGTRGERPAANLQNHPSLRNRYLRLNALKDRELRNVKSRGPKWSTEVKYPTITSIAKKGEWKGPKISAESELSFGELSANLNEYGNLGGAIYLKGPGAEAKAEAGLFQPLDLQGDVFVAALGVRGHACVFNTICLNVKAEAKAGTAKWTARDSKKITLAYKSFEFSAAIKPKKKQLTEELEQKLDAINMLRMARDTFLTYSFDNLDNAVSLANLLNAQREEYVRQAISQWNFGASVQELEKEHPEALKQLRSQWEEQPSVKHKLQLVRSYAEKARHYLQKAKRLEKKAKARLHQLKKQFNKASSRIW